MHGDLALHRACDATLIDRLAGHDTLGRAALIVASLRRGSAASEPPRRADLRKLSASSSHDAASPAFAVVPGRTADQTAPYVRIFAIRQYAEAVILQASVSRRRRD